MDDNNLIYHYCSLNTFLTIIQNKTLRLSQVLKSNDRLERNYLLSECENLIYQSLQKWFAGKLDGNGNVCVKAIQGALNQEISHYENHTIIAHAMCFSTEGDLLSQWRGYADDGRGMAIGFDRAALEKYFNNGQCLAVSDIVYNENNAEIINKELNEISSTLKNSYLYQSAPIIGIINGICNKLVGRLFLGKALIYKHPSFKEEKEVRIRTNISQENFGKLTDQRVESFINEIEEEIKPFCVSYGFSTKANTIVSHLDIHYDYVESSCYIPNELIKCVVIGPKAKVSIHELEHFMRFYRQGGAVIKKSSSPYV